MGYLKKLKYGVTLLKLTRRALDEISDDNLAPIETTRYLKQKVRTQQIGHDLGVIDSKITLKESPIISDWEPALNISYYQYKEYYSDRLPKMPDSVFNIRMGDRILKTALEYEMTQKESGRYKMILEHYYTDKKVDLLFYIARTAHLKKKLLEIGRNKLNEISERQIAHQNILYVTTLDEFREKGLEAKFQGVMDGTFSIKELEDRVKNLQTPSPNFSQAISQAGGSPKIGV